MIVKDIKICMLVCAVSVAGSANSIANDSSLRTTLPDTVVTADSETIKRSSSEGYHFFATANAQAVRQQSETESSALNKDDEAERGTSTSRSALAWIVGTLLLSTMMLSKNIKRRA